MAILTFRHACPVYSLLTPYSEIFIFQNDSGGCCPLIAKGCILFRSILTPLIIGFLCLVQNCYGYQCHALSSKMGETPCKGSEAMNLKHDMEFIPTKEGTPKQIS